MDLNFGSDQQQAVDAFRRLLERGSSSAQVRAAETAGFDAELWREAADMGVTAMGVPAESGGAGLGLLDVALLAEVQGEFLASIPFVESNVAARLLARCGAAGRDLLNAVLSRGAMATLAVADAASFAEPQPVPAGAVAEIVVMLEGDKLIALRGTPPGRRLRNLGASPLAFRSRNDAGAIVTLLAEGDAAKELHARAADEWRALTAAALYGLGRKALQLGVDYARTRQAFGTVIGSYQGIAHPLGDMAASLDGAMLLARSAAAAADEAPATPQEGAADRFAVLSSMALVFCAGHAQRTAAFSLHVHGGYGFTLEYDIQLYLRRAKAWPLLMHDPRREYQRVAGLLLEKNGTMEKWIFG